MPGAFAPRFAIEAGFLILLGVGSGLADVRPALIVAILAGGWLLVSLIEVFAWKTQERPVSAYTHPVGPSVDQESEAGWTGDDTQGVDLEAESEDAAYPLRADAGDAPSEEIEAYTRVIGSHSDSVPADDRGE